ncbi:MAG: P-II family nitrogen regulator [Verrucomicrobiota bacterium]
MWSCLATEIERGTRVEVACHDAELDAILNTIAHAAHLNPPNPGDRGKVFVFPLLDAIRLKTGVRGEQALGMSDANSNSD